MTRRERLRALLARRRQRTEIVIRLRPLDDDPAPAATLAAQTAPRHQEPRPASDQTSARRSKCWRCEAAVRVPTEGSTSCQSCGASCS